MIVSDSRLFSEKKNILKNYDFIGRPGYTMAEARRDILNHYEYHSTMRDFVCYKIVCGINDVTSRCNVNGQLIIGVNPNSHIENYILEILNFQRLHSKLFISFVEIPFAHIDKYNYFKSNQSSIFEINHHSRNQYLLQRIVDGANQLISINNNQWWVDIESNHEFAKKINKNVSMKKEKLTRMERLEYRADDQKIPTRMVIKPNFNRLYDGVHLQGFGGNIQPYLSDKV